jgi:hypothetical protein
VTYSDVQGGWFGTGNLNLDPRFVRSPSPGADGKWGTDDDDYGDLRLQPGSPCIDKGSDAAVTTPRFPTNDTGTIIDLDANPRTSRAHVDLGAFEYQNQAPTANPQSVALDQDTSHGITLTGSDPENDALTYQVAAGPQHGMLGGTPPSLTYTPTAGYAGPDRFTFTVTDAYGAVSTAATVSITVRDTIPPVITLNGANPMTVTQGSVFTDPGAVAVDTLDGLVDVSVSGSVDTAVPGTYTLTYSAQDRAGNEATATRTVNVVATLLIEEITIKRAGNNAQVKFVLRNPGSTPATGVQLSGATLGGVACNQALPLPLGSLAAGASTSVTLTFKVSAGPQTLALTGTSSLGSFGLTQSLVVP